MGGRFIWFYAEDSETGVERVESPEPQEPNQCHCEADLHPQGEQDEQKDDAYNSNPDRVHRLITSDRQLSVLISRINASIADPKAAINTKG